jgi:TRAP transporter TAXI family solute receptor
VLSVGTAVIVPLVFDGGASWGEIFMLGFGRWHLFKGLATIFGILAITSLALVYFIPAPPKKISIATAFKGGAYELFGNRYKEILARSGIAVEVLLTEGSGENLRLLQNGKTQVGIVGGGVSNAKASPYVVSLGRISYQPFWIFYRASETWPDLTFLQGKRIAVGPVGSATRVLADRLLSIAGVSSQSETLLPIFGPPAVTAMIEGKADATFLPGALDSPLVQAMLRNPGIRLMNIERAEAITRLYPFLVKLVLPAGVIDFANRVPATDVTIVGITNAVLVRKDLDPEIVRLLAQAMVEVHGGAGVFERAGEFPTQTDPEYSFSEAALEYYRNGPSFLNSHVPFWLTIHIRRLTAVLLAVFAILFPIILYTPKLYRWIVREQMLKLYRGLRRVENGLQNELSSFQVIELQRQLEDIDRAASVLWIPNRHSDMFFSFKIHTNLIRTRLAARLVEARSQEAKAA